MLVFGDHARERDPRDLLRELDERLRGVRDHAALVSAFVVASELAQGLVDADPALDAPAIAMLVELARSIAAAWDGERVTGAPHALAWTETRALPERIRTKRAEGYAFYALYPETYLLAARQAPGAAQVIGLRSIGIGLAAMVTVGGGGVPLSLRPEGEPFDRQVQLPAVRAPVAVVDEGPGLSGSSFGAVLDALEAQGVELDQITCFPSHGGELGPIASERHRERWRRVRRVVVPFEAVLDRITVAIATLVGPVRAPLEDIAGGAWRAHHYPDERAWPPVVAYQERRKYLARTARGTWLARFVGLGPDGDAALARAQVLQAAGFTPEVAGLAHGFLVERWHADGTPLDRTRIDRRYLVERVGRYLALRAGRPARGGATLALQREMVRRNAGVELAGDLADLEARRSPVEIDGRMHAWEWIVLGDGTLVKTDAYDHHAAHDLIGCQDITWDIAGATVELGLTATEQQQVIAIVSAISGRDVDRDLLRVARTSYLAFQLGRAALAADSATHDDARRLRRAAERYASLLRG